MERYSDCQRNDSMCGQCSLVSRGLDCHNNRINGIRYKRTAAGMTQKELAEKAGLNIRQIQKYENGEIEIRSMSLGKALAIADVLECEVKELL